MACIWAVVSLVRTNALFVLSNSTMEAEFIVFGFSPIFTWAFAQKEMNTKESNSLIFVDI